MDFPGSFAPLSPGDNYIADLVHDDWLAPAVNASELTDFPDDAIAASLAAFSGRDDDDFDLAFLHDNRHQTRSPAMRASFSMNDLTVLQHQPVQHVGGWNHKLVSVKPKLQSVPEGSTFTGGPLNLMPLPNGMHVSGTAVGSDSHMQPIQQHTDGLDISMDDFADLDTDPLSGLHKQVPSHTNTLTQQLQMTHMQPDSQMPGLDHNTGYGAASGLSQVNTMGIYQAPPMGMANGHHHLQGSQQGSQTFQPSQAMGAHDNASGSANTAGAGANMQRRQASGLPLRKSQSAVELGSWRSFSCGDEFWDSETGEPTKAWKLSPEERMLRIQRYREKRLNRNFNPAVKYQCRKSLADTRPRVRGRFARNDDVGIVLPHETKKAQRERDRASGSSTDVLSSGGQTSSGGGTPAHMQMTSTGQGVGGSNGQGATSQMTAVFTAPAQQHPAAHQNGQYQAGSTISAPAALHGISMIGASPEPLLQPDLGLSMGMIGRHGGSSAAGLQQPGVSMLPPLLPSSFPPMPPPLTSPGCIFTSAGQRGVGSTGPAASTSSNMMYTGMMPAPYMPSGQTIFTGQTIFSGASLHVPGAGGYQPPSGTASAHPSISPPLCAVSPTASDSHSHSHSVGLSLGDLSTGHSL